MRSRFHLLATFSIASLLSSMASADTPKLPEPPIPDRDKLLRAGGGNDVSEAAVARGLAWLSRKQLKDGSWEFDGLSKDQIAATGMALLPFLAAGQSPDGEAKYAKVVKAGLDWLVNKLQKDGSFKGAGTMYAHAIGSIALCDAVRVAKEEKLKEKAELTIQYILKSQGANGSWGYTGGKPTEGDTSIIGWQVQALASAKMAGIKIDENKSYKQANKFLESVSTDSGAKYGYREKGASQTLTPVGLLSRYYMTEKDFTPRNPAYGRGVDFIKQYPPQKGYFDMYYYYYATRVVFFYEGPDWHKFWNPKMRDMLIDLQNKGGDDGMKGSWDKDQGFIGSSCGKLGTTALALLTLEVYYRYPHLHKLFSGDLKELER
jgi:Prenyltransferase and squalene oxidase repeat